MSTNKKEKGDNELYLAIVPAVLIVGILYCKFDWPFLISMFIGFILIVINLIIYSVVFEKTVDKKNEQYKMKVKSNDKYITDRQIQQKLQHTTSIIDESVKSDLISAGAWLLCCDADTAPVLALTEHGGVTKCDFLHKVAVKPNIGRRSGGQEKYTYTTTAPKASATKRAVIGGLIGGSTGAVIGAVSANEANAKGAVEKTQTRYVNTYYNCLDINGGSYYEFCVAKKMYEYMKLPELKRYKVDEKDNYYLITGNFTHGGILEEDELNLICEKFKKAWSTMNS